MSRRNSLMVKRTYYQMGMVTLFSVLLWVSISIYTALLSPSDVGVDNSILSPVTATIDEVTLASISARKQIGKNAILQVADFPAATESASPSPTTPPKPVVVASPSASLESSNSAGIIGSPTQ